MICEQCHSTNLSLVSNNMYFRKYSIICLECSYSIRDMVPEYLPIDQIQRYKDVIITKINKK